MILAAAVAGGVAGAAVAIAVFVYSVLAVVVPMLVH